MTRLKRRMMLSAMVLVALWSVTATCLLVNRGAGRVAALPATASAPADVDPVEKFRTEREQLRAEQAAQLNELAHDESADADIVASAQRQLMDLMRSEEAECTLEGLLEARGFAGALVTVHTGAVNVLVRTDALTKQQAAIIMDLVMRETGVSGGNVKIIPIN